MHTRPTSKPACPCMRRLCCSKFQKSSRKRPAICVRETDAQSPFRCGTLPPATTAAARSTCRICGSSSAPDAAYAAARPSSTACQPRACSTQRAPERGRSYHGTTPAPYNPRRHARGGPMRSPRDLHEISTRSCRWSRDEVTYVRGGSFPGSSHPPSSTGRRVQASLPRFHFTFGSKSSIRTHPTFPTPARRRSLQATRPAWRQRCL